MKSLLTLIVSVLLITAGCAESKSDPKMQSADVPKVTVPNGHSPASDNAPHGGQNDGDDLRRNFNHGNGVLWVTLPKDGVIHAEVQKDGWLRIKYPWWRGVKGDLTVEGRRLDAPAPPMRTDVATSAQVGDIGINPGILMFPTEGYWEITGHVGNKSLTFVVKVVKET